jgi:predicted FMN-binding regulatory protein PaiB
MKHHSHYEQKNAEEINSLIQSMSMCILSTGADGKNQNGVFNPVYKDGLFYFHFNKTDDQFKMLERSSSATLIFFDFLCNIPSYWVDENDGGVATSYYRYAEFKCEVKTYSSPEEIHENVGIFLDKYQPEGGYSSLSMDKSFYLRAYKMLGMAELKPIETISKWKLGQNRPVELRQSICEKLMLRNIGNDFRAAEEVTKWISQNN